MTQRLRIENIHKSFPVAGGAVDVLRGISLALDGAETVALTGESGSGKSTLLHLAGGLDTPDRGQILVEGQDLAVMSDKDRAQVRRETLGLVFQQFNLIPSLTAAENIGFQSRLAQRRDPKFEDRLAERLGLSDVLNRYPEQLSGGQQQRVAIARALAPKPSLILADEPTGNLDEETGDTVLDLFLDLIAETGAALLMVTHSPRLALRLDRRLHLRLGQISDSARAA